MYMMWSTWIISTTVFKHCPRMCISRNIRNITAIRRDRDGYVVPIYYNISIEFRITYLCSMTYRAYVICATLTNIITGILRWYHLTRCDECAVCVIGISYLLYARRLDESIAEIKKKLPSTTTAIAGII